MLALPASETPAQVRHDGQTKVGRCDEGEFVNAENCGSTGRHFPQQWQAHFRGADPVNRDEISQNCCFNVIFQWITKGLEIPQRRNFNLPTRAIARLAHWRSGNANLNPRRRFCANQSPRRLERHLRSFLKRKSSGRLYPSMIATARVQPAEARSILTGKHDTVNPLEGRSSRLCSFSMWQ